jgi:peptidoglycan-associated lipoprotein
MKKTLLQLLALTTLAALPLIFGGCAADSKSHTAGENMDGSLPTEGAESLNGANLYDGIPQNARPEGIDPEKDVDYSVLASETVYFGYDSFNIKASERGKLEKISKWLTDNPGKRLMLAGHTDDRGTLEYNRGLGERRALAIREYLSGLGIAQDRLFTISYGEERPASQGSTENDFAQNRRVCAGVITK